MDQVDSLNEMALQSTPMTNVNNVAGTSEVIAVAADLPSFQYFISEHAKSIQALQELQNEVGALLEFRDLVMEAFPQLGQKVQHMQSQNAISPSKWEPGIRVKRKLGQQLRDPDILVPSLLPRYRSNSQGKGSRSGDISSSATSSSAIQDSGFCTESSKDHLSSALSSRSKSRDTADELFSLLDNIHHKGTRLKLEVEYLWNRLHHKDASSLVTGAGSGGGGSGSGAIGVGGTKRRCKSLDDLIFLATNSSGGSSAAAAAAAAHSFTFEYAMKTAFLETELCGLKRERDTLLKKLNEIEGEHLANLAQTNRLLSELETMSAEKRELEERLHFAIRPSTSAVAAGDEVGGSGGGSDGGQNGDGTREDDDGDPRARVNERLHHANLLRRNNNKWRNAQTPFAQCQLLKLEQVFKGSSSNRVAIDESGSNSSSNVNANANAKANVNGDGDLAAANVAVAAVSTVAAAAATATTTTTASDASASVTHAMLSSRAAVATFKDEYFRWSTADKLTPIERPGNPVTKELNNTSSYLVEEGDCPPDRTFLSPEVSAFVTTTFASSSSNNNNNNHNNTNANAASVVTLASATREFGDDQLDRSHKNTAIVKVCGSGDAASGGGGGGVGNKKPDVLVGFIGGHPASFDGAKVVSLSKEKVLSILNEFDTQRLHCFLLTLSYQVEALNVHVQRISKSRMNIFKQLNKYKFENEDLKLELKRKEIELEGTKAQKRVLEQKRDIKLSYSTSDLMTSIPKLSCGGSGSGGGGGASSGSSGGVGGGGGNSSSSNCCCNCSATSDMRTDPGYTCSVSDSVLMGGGEQPLSSQRSGAICCSSSAGTAKNSVPVSGSELRDSTGGVGVGGGAAAATAITAAATVDRAMKNSGTGCRRTYSKIPLKTYSSKLPTKLNSSSAKKTLTSFKEYSAPGPPHSSCISSATSSSSLNHK